MIILYDFHFFGKNILASGANLLPDNKKGRAPFALPVSGHYISDKLFC
jgi:hypothetical protein